MWANDTSHLIWSECPAHHAANTQICHLTAALVVATERERYAQNLLPIPFSMQHGDLSRSEVAVLFYCIEQVLPLFLLE